MAVKIRMTELLKNLNITVLISHLSICTYSLYSSGWLNNDATYDVYDYDNKLYTDLVHN